MALTSVRNSATRDAVDATLWERDIEDVPTALAVAPRSATSDNPGLCAVAGEGGVVRLIETDSGRLQGRLILPGGVRQLSFSPDGGVAAYAGPRGYTLWRVADGAVLHRETAHPARFAWAPDRRCAVAHGGTVQTYDTATGLELGRPLTFADPVDDLAWFDHGRALAVAAGGEVRVFGARSRVAAWTYPAPVHILGGAGDGGWLCAAGDTHTVWIRGLDDTQEDLYAIGPGVIDSLGKEPHGALLAAESDGALTVWDLGARGGRVRPRPRRIGHDIAYRAYAWSPDRPAVLATGGTDGTLRVWDLRPGPLRRPTVPVLTLHTGAPIKAVAWHGAETILLADRSGRLAAYRVG